MVLVAPPAERARWRSHATDSGMTVIGEVTSLDEARSIEGADAYLVAARRRRTADRSLLIEALTPREMQVLELLAEGLPNKAIAARLDISDQTVKFHVASICGKLGASNRTDAVRRAVARGVLTL